MRIIVLTCFASLLMLMGAQAQNNAIFNTGIGSGNYWGCITDSLLNNNSPVFDLEMCEGDSVMIGGIYYTTAGTYYDTLIASNGCDSFIITNLKVNPLPIVDAGENITVSADSCIQLKGLGGGNYFWNPTSGLSCINCQSPVACPESTTTYTLTVSNANGCINIDSVTVTVTVSDEVICNANKVFVPNAFTPNNDDLNDILKIYGNGSYNITFKIFDRWGEMVFESFDDAKGWDGTYNGKKMNAGVFVYSLKIECENGDTVFKTGSITLLK